MWFQDRRGRCRDPGSSALAGTKAAKSLGSGRGEEVLTEVPGGLGVVVAGSGKGGVGGGVPKKLGCK